MRCDPVDAGTPLHGCMAACACASRRSFLASVGALGAASVLPAPAAWAEGTVPAPAIAKPHRVDVHHHMFPPFVQERWRKDNIRVTPAAMRWTLAATLEQMNEGGVATAILSMASGGLNLLRLRVNENRSMTRMVNDYAAK